MIKEKGQTDKQRFTKYYTENKIERTQLKTGGNSVAPEG